MNINNNLKNLIFYFFLFGLTGCTGLRKARLDCLPKETPNGVDKKQHQQPIYKQKKQDSFATHLSVTKNNGSPMDLAFCKNALLGELDKRIAQLVESVLICLLNFEFDIPNASLNCSFDALHRKIADAIWSAFHTILSTFLKQNTKKLRESAYACYADPDFMDSLTAPFETTSHASEPSAEINNNFNIIEFLEFYKKISLATLDNYNGKLCGYSIMYVFNFRFDMSDGMPNCSSDAIHQIMAGFILYMTHIVFKAVLKQKTAEVRKFAFAYCSDPDFINSLMTSCQALSNALYAGLSIAAPAAKYAFSTIRHGISYIGSPINYFTNWAIDNTIYQKNRMIRGASLCNFYFIH